MVSTSPFFDYHWFMTAFATGPYTGLFSYTSPCGFIWGERVWALRPGGECAAVVLGLVWTTIWERFAE